MKLMKTYTLENGTYLGVSYFTNVENLKLLKENMLSIFKDKSPVLIRSKLIIDPFQIVVAANHASMTHQYGLMVTKLLATEILFNLSNTRKISQSLKEVSADDDDDNMIVAIISKFKEVPEMDIFYEKCITGTEEDLSKLTEMKNEKYVMAYYKIDPTESENSSLLDSIVTRIACKAIL